MRHGGEEVKTVGDGFLVELPASAIRCALAVRARLADIELKVRAGVHCGECELIGGDVGGLGVHIAARFAALAYAGEVLVSGTVKDTVTGWGIDLEDRGTLAQGRAGELSVFAASPSPLEGR